MLQHTRESEVLSLAQIWNRGRRGHAEKTRAEMSNLCPADMEVDHLVVSNSASDHGFLGCPQAES